MLIDIFPTKIEIINNFLTQDEIDNVYSYIKKLSHTDHSTIIGDGKSTHSHFSNFLKGIRLEKKINDEIEKYCNSYGIRNSEIKICWSNIQKKNSFLKMHSHGNTPISGAIFIKTDEKSSKLCFHNPNPHSVVTNYFIEPNPNVVCYKPNIGDLFIFPGWLQHGSNYELNKSEERVVLSFNCEHIK
jgi:uncharacterized protein (TIGR02466 family)